MVRHFALLPLLFGTPAQAVTVSLSAEMTKYYGSPCTDCPDSYSFKETGYSNNRYLYGDFNLGKFLSRVTFQIDYWNSRFHPSWISGTYSENGFIYHFEGRGSHNGDLGYLYFAKTTVDEWIVTYRSVGNVNVMVDGQPFGFVPEPAAWALLIIGFGAIGVGLRRRAQVCSIGYRSLTIEQR